MAKKNILIQPLITEKSENATEVANRYTFVVDKRANKLEVKNAVEKMFGVSVQDVNTAIMPTKPKSRYSRAGVVKGRKPSYKKASVRLAEGDVIDFYGDL